ncbi:MULTISPECIES: FAD/NAD(P)-binding protein [unclassified Streptomyces]|uniref:FAD/NAD(P)-binding protein n=1 Tax=unclassified Streptomyces TaxID=2593676 RepID=UPI0033253DE4
MQAKEKPVAEETEGRSKAAPVDVVIVGAGFAGLSAAERLVNMGMSVRVIEGRDRVGGRSYSGEVAGVKVDLGAAWVAERHTAIRDLALRLGCSTISQFHEALNILWMAGVAPGRAPCRWSNPWISRTWAAPRRTGTSCWRPSKRAPVLVR